MSEIKEVKKFPPRTEMPMISPDIRIKNFDEVALGFSEEQALLEATRCLKCKKPKCMEACPVGVEVPEFINFIQQKEYQKAIDKIREKNCLPGTCGRVCPQENLCEGACVQGKKNQPVSIGALQRFVADWELKNGKMNIPEITPTGKKVAIIGSGPAGLAAARDLALMGHQVTIMEALHIPGGVMVYGIPEFRLPNSFVLHEIDNIRKLGVEIKTNVVIGKTTTIDALLGQGYDAVFIGTGEGAPYFMKIKGEILKGVYSFNEFLMRINLMKGYLHENKDLLMHIGEKVAVIGGGNVAMDCARTALRLGAKETYIVYRRSMTELPSRREEIEHAEAEGVKFRLLLSPIEIKGNDQGWVKSIICQKYELGEPDDSGRRSPVPVKDATEEIEVDTVIMAIGQAANPLVSDTTPDMQTNKWGNIIIDENTGETNKKGVFAGGDIVTGADTVISAMRAGKKAAQAINDYLMK